MQLLRTSMMMLVVVLTACTTGNEPGSSRPLLPTNQTTLISTVTTADVPLTSSTSSSQGTSAPTVVVPQRPRGLSSLELTDEDLADIVLLSPSVQDVLPHDRTAVTEGLAFIDDQRLLESTGFYGRSSRRIINVTEGDLGSVVRLTPELYGTGIALLVGVDGPEGAQFTKHEGVMQRFNLDDLETTATVRLDAEINGACPLSENEIALSTADGGLAIVASPSLETLRTIDPVAGSTPLSTLTDLSCASGAIWAIVGTSSV
ncbi:MAG: hypothetical protein HKN24_14855, partial [Acidimicrobiales bacterium]|nr:hypothetical protein [Acidimicrobiales bacterium]